MNVKRLVEMLGNCNPDAVVKVHSDLGDNRYREAFEIEAGTKTVLIRCCDDEIIIDEEEITNG